MTPVVTPSEMRAVDAAAPETTDVLIGRAGEAIAIAAVEMLGSPSGRVVYVLAGPGNNGADGHDAARRLSAAGATIHVVDARECPDRLPPADLVIDAAFGTGFSIDRVRSATSDRPTWKPPEVDGVPVLAVDIPSGVDGVSGRAVDGALAARRTVTFQALKPGLLFEAGARLAGQVTVVDIGLDVGAVRCHRIDPDDVVSWWPRRAVDAHKWHGAVKVIAGSPEMPGAAELCTAAALRAGSGLVSLSAPGVVPRTRSEIVQRHVALTGFADIALDDIERFGALVIGPGLGGSIEMRSEVGRCIDLAPCPIVIDGDAINAVGGRSFVGRDAATVITPHDGEFERLTGSRPGADRIGSVREAARVCGATILLKGPTTVIATPEGDVLVVDHGDERLATAGSGDVLSGILGAVLATGIEPLRGAAVSAWIHAEAARCCSRHGLVAGDIIEALPRALTGMLG